jgi:hypothetical protein
MEPDQVEATRRCLRGERPGQLGELTADGSDRLAACDELDARARSSWKQASSGEEENEEARAGHDERISRDFVRAFAMTEARSFPC